MTRSYLAVNNPAVSLPLDHITNLEQSFAQLVFVLVNGKQMLLTVVVGGAVKPHPQTLVKRTAAGTDS